MSDNESSCHCEVTPDTKIEIRILKIVFVLNFGMFLIEFTAGIFSESIALLADSLDMFADAFIYALSLFALKRHEKWRVYAALSSGIIQLILGLGIALSAIYRLVLFTTPDFKMMGIYGFIALIVNVISFWLLSRFREGNINIKASWICSRNDIIANIGVLIAAVLVYYLNSGFPDILIGISIAAIVIVSSYDILVEAKQKGKELK
ncbi:MAG: cation diffusion facilitator family transporter [Gammaproteobacteria bacterium]